MVFVYILLAILAVIVVLLAICVIRAVMNKPTAAQTATIDAKFDERAKNYGERLGEMIQCETISSRYNDSRDKFYEFHKVLEKLYPLIHQNCEKNVFNGSLLFKWPGKGKAEPVLFMSHMDVVEATGEWEHGAFSGEVVDGKVWGRGTVDTKGNLFCFMQAAEELMAEGYEPDGDIYLASSCTEEHSGEGAPLTVQYLKDNGLKLRLMLDEGGMIMENPIAGLQGTYGVVGVLEKGYGDLKFVAKSRGGHSSAPTKNDALLRLGRFIASCDKDYPFTAKLNPTVEEMFRRFAPNMNFPMKLVLSNLWLFRPVVEKVLPKMNALAGAMIRTTLAFTTAKGSDGLNVLPQTAYVTGNLRFIHHQGVEESVRIISERAKQFDIETEIIYTDEPCPVVDYKSEAFHLVEETMNEIYPGVGVSPYVMTGGTDSKFYRDVCDNALRFAPLYITDDQFKGIHGLNENIDAAALSPAVDFYRSFIKKV